MAKQDSPAERILVAEDAPALRLLLETYLCGAGRRLHLAANGQEAVDRFAPGRYDLVILDMKMPVLDGFAAARRIREREAADGAPPVPILAFTADEDKAADCLAAGCTRVLGKPYRREDLLAAVAECLSCAPPPTEAPPAGADPEIADLIPVFLANCRADAAAMAASLSRRDFEALASAGHRLVGSGASYGFPPISAAGRAIEAAARRTDEAAARRALDELSGVLRRAEGALG